MTEVISKEEKSFTCTLCVDVLKDPVTIPCGHNFCMKCITLSWDQEDCKGVYSCPLCKQMFTLRPVLCINPLITEMVEKFRKSRIQQAAAAHCFARPGDVECDVCMGRKLTAIKSCLDCQLSYCETHFKVHNDVNPGRKHSVTDAISQTKERICSRHKKVFEIFCRTDQSCICYLCTMDDHKGHDTVAATAECTNKQKQLGQTQRRFQKNIQEREKELQELRKALETLKSSAQAAVEESEKIFTEMIHSIERRRLQVKELIRAQEEAEVSRAEGLLKQLEQEIAELKRRDAELELLSHTQDHIYFLKNLPSVRDPPRSKDLPSMTFSQNISFEAVKESVSAVKLQLAEKLDDIFKQEVVKISAAVMSTQIFQSLTYSDPELLIRGINSADKLPSKNSNFELLIRGTTRANKLPPKMSNVQSACAESLTRDELLQYTCHFTLDPNTAHRRLHLENKRVEWGAQVQSYPDHAERFDEWEQVLCREGVAGRCYWEVEWSEGVNIAVSYKSISRKGKGKECSFGFNDQSWNLVLRRTSTTFWHNKNEIRLPLVTNPRIGVYVDHRAGALAFYSVSDTVTLLHKVQTTFTDTLYPGFFIGVNSSVKFE